MPIQTNTPSPLVNPHLEGGAFFWPAGRVGVLLIHGFGATSAEVRPLAHSLHQSGYSVAGPLLPGHGTTPEDANRCTWPQWLRAADEVYQQLAGTCHQVFIGGESMGGMLALHLAAERPEAAGILAYAPALQLGSPWIRWIAPLLARWKSVQSKSPHTPIPSDEYWQGYPVYPMPAMVQLLALQRATWPRLAAIHQPLLLVQGRLDRTVHPSTPAQIARRVSSAVVDVHWMERSTHCVIIDAEQEQVAQLTLNFLQRFGQ